MDIVKKENVDMLLAVGGGSVADTAKCIAVGVYDDGDAWEDFYVGNKEVKKAMPVSCILTIAAAGSEGSNSSVITYKGIKGDLGCELIRPVLSIMNPELTMTLPAYQTACGVSDLSLIHILRPCGALSAHRIVSSRPAPPFVIRLLRATKPFIKRTLHNIV